MRFFIRTISIYVTMDSPNGPEIRNTQMEHLSFDTVFSLLSHRRRRVVLELLLTHDRALTLRDLRNGIVEKEHGAEIVAVNNDQVKQTLVSLHHIHIPVLAEAGLVIYDQDRMIVEPTEKIGLLEPLLSYSSNK
ncbi:DUF7344 domain-containing protein [Halostagnicola larsenii]